MKLPPEEFRRLMEKEKERRKKQIEEEKERKRVEREREKAENKAKREEERAVKKIERDRVRLNYELFQAEKFGKIPGENEQYHRKEIQHSFDCSHHRILSTDSKVRTTLCSITNSTAGKHYSVAFI